MLFQNLMVVVPALSMVSAIAIDFTHRNVTAEEFMKNPDLLSEEVAHHEPGHEPRAAIVGGPGTCVPKTNRHYTLNGNGTPHQNFKITELGGSMIGCPGGTTSKTYSHETGWTIDARIGAKVGGTGFASLDFKVEDLTTISHTETFSCDGDFDEICMLSYQAVTAITVDFWETTIGCALNEKTHLGTGVVYLPNDNSQTSGGSVMRKGVNHAASNQFQCRGGSDDREVDFLCGPPGGPDWFMTHDDGPGTQAYLDAREPAGCPIPIEAYHWS